MIFGRLLTWCPQRSQGGVQQDLLDGKAQNRQWYDSYEENQPPSIPGPFPEETEALL